MEPIDSVRGARAPRAPRTFALAAALAVAMPAAAARPPPAAVKAPSAAGRPSQAPAPRPELLEAPPPAPAAMPRALAAPVARPAAAIPARAAPSWRAGPALGFEFGLGDQKYDGVKVRIDAERELRALSPTTTLSFVTSFSASHPAGTEDVPLSVNPYTGVVLEQATLEWDVNVFELVPAARLVYAATPKVSFFADGGVGVTYTSARAYVPTAALGMATPDLVEDGVGAVLRLAGGLAFTPTPSLRIGVEALGLHLRFGDGPGTAFDLLVSISHRL